MSTLFTRYTVTLQDYTDGVVTLMKMALNSSGGSRTCAQVLLSCYNDTVYQLACTDLCNLDDEHLDAAFKVLLGRATLMREPQGLLENGEELFGQLWEKWAHLSVKGRAISRGYIDD